MVTLQSPSKDGSALLTYLVDDPPHDGESQQRNLWTETIGLMPSANAKGYIRQFRHEWDRAGPLAERHKNQMRHLIISPSNNEITYDPENAETLAKMVKAFVEKEYPNRRAIIVVQQDSPNGIDVEDGNGNMTTKKILHAHVALSDWDINTLKGVPKEQTSFKWLSATFDEFITSNYGIQIDHGNNRKRRRYMNKKLVVEGERDKTGKFYSYIDDIKDRINRCAADVNSMADFWDRLKDFGLSVSHKIMKKTQEEYETYYLHDLSNISAESKDKNGKLKKLAKKGQLPGMRSYKQKGYSIDEIEFKIKHKTIAEPEHVPMTDDNLTTEIYDTGIEERHEFYCFCQENDIEYGDGDEFDRDKYEDAKRLFNEFKNKNDSIVKDPATDPIENVVTDSEIVFESPTETDITDTQKELSYKRYQRAKEVIPINYTINKQRQR